MFRRNNFIKIIGLILIAALFFAVLPSSGATAQTTINVCGSGCDYTSIQAAIDAAAAGDIIEVAEGTYNENISIPKSLTLQGEGRDLVTIEGVSPTTDSGVLEIKADNVIIDGFTIQGVGNKTVRVTAATANLEFTNNTVITAENSTDAGGWSAFETNYNQAQDNHVIDNNIFVANTTSTLVYYNPTQTNLAFTNNTFTGTMGTTSGLVFAVDGADGTQDISGNIFDLTAPYALVEMFGTYDLGQILADNTWPEGAIIDANKIITPPPVHNITQDTYFYAIQPAIDAANTEDVIEVEAGKYVENVSISIPLTLKGEGRDVVTLEGQPPTFDSGVLEIKADDVTIDGFEIVGVGNKTVRITSPTDGLVFQNNRLIAAENTTSAGGWSVFETDYNDSQSNHLIDRNIFIGDNSHTVLYYNPSLSNITVTNNVFTGTVFDGGLVAGFDGLDGTQNISGNDFTGISSTYALLELFGTYDIVDAYDLNMWPDGYIPSENKVVPISTVYPSTNEINRTNGWAHVNKVSANALTDEISLEFVQPQGFYSCFEYRTDGDTSQKISEDNFNDEIEDGLYPYICLNEAGSSTIETFELDEYIEVRLSFGAEKNERFYWTRFDMLEEVWVCESGDCGHPDAQFDSIQSAIDAVAIGGTVNVYPGMYDETASDRTLFNGAGPYQFGLFFEEEKEGLTLQGIDSAGDPITDYNDVAASITTNATNSFGYSGVFVEADNVTITGLEFLENTPSDNKTIEVIGDNFTFRYNLMGVQDNGSLYLNDWRYEENTSTSHVESFTIEDNWFRYSANISISSGVGVTGDVANRTIINNLFTADMYWLGISFNGNVPSVGWFNYPVGGAVITDNTFEGVGVPIQSRGTVEETDFDWLGYWENNNFDKAVVAWDTDAGMPRSFDYTVGSYLLNNTRRIGSVIQTEVNNAEENDQVWVADGTYVEEILIDKPVHIIGQGSGTIIQSPDTITQLFGSSSHPIVLIQDTDDVAIENLVIDGAGKGNANYKFVGVAFSNAGGLLQDLTLTGISDTPFSGAQHGVAVMAFNGDGVTRSISLQDNTFIDFQKNAIALIADESTRLLIDVQGNTITGAGATDVTGQNGIQVSAAQADGIIANNTVSGIGYSGSGWVATSILIYQNNFGEVLIDNNTITEAQVGVYVYDGGAMISNNTIEVEKIGDFSYGIIATDPPIAIPQPYGEESIEISVEATKTRATLPVAIEDNTISVVVDENDVLNDVSAETWGILAYGGVTMFDLDLTVTGNIINGFDYGVEIFQADIESGEIVSVEAHQNCIIDSQIFAMLSNAETITINAINNFWGDPTGPFHSTLNPEGEGGEVSDYINFEPWLDVCPLIEQPEVPFEYFFPLVTN